MNRIESINETTVQIEGRVIAHTDIMRWAKTDAAWALVAKEIAVEVKSLAKFAYESYCRKSQVVSSAVVGHGSISIGPDRSAQARYQMLDAVVSLYR